MVFLITSSKVLVSSSPLIDCCRSIVLGKFDISLSNSPLPLFSDLIHYIPYFDTEFVENKQANPVTDLVQLCYVLPKQSLQFLPDKLYNNLLKYHSDWYSNDCSFVWAYCRYFWESHVNLPHIDINELEKFVAENK